MEKKREKTKYFHILFSIVSVAYHRLRKVFLKKKGEREEKGEVVKEGEKQLFLF